MKGRESTDRGLCNSRLYFDNIICVLGAPLWQLLFVICSLYHNAFLTGVWAYHITDNTMFRPKILLKHVNMINIATLHM